MRLGGGTEKKLVANMGGARDEFCLVTSCDHSSFDFRDLDEVGETHTGHVELKIGSGRG